LKTHEDDRTLTVLNAYDTSGNGAGFSTIVDRKGPSESAVKWGTRVLYQLGHAAVILQPDPENASGALIEEIAKRSSGRASVRKSACFLAVC
jgi:hypothetical protein